MVTTSFASHSLESFIKDRQVLIPPEDGDLKKPGYFNHLTVYMLNVLMEFMHVFTFYGIPPHWHAIDNWNPSSYKTGTHLFYTVNIMVADVLAPQGARPSATMMLT